jgi:DNA-binding NarL/FixJ family response regulator
MKRKILFVGGNAAEISQTQQALHQEPYEILVTATVEEARVQLAGARISVVIANETIGKTRGADFLAEVQKLQPTGVRLMIAENGQADALIDAVNRAEIYRFLAPPLNPPATARVLRDALNLARVAEAQEAVWNAAKQQQDALQELVRKNVSSDEADSAVPAARFAGLIGEATATREKIGDLPQEHARRLSTRENEIVQALSSGRRVKDIAQDLVISTHTVRNHLKAIYRKLNVRSQFELISLMARHSRDT